MKELAEIIHSKAFTIFVATLCGVFVLSELKKTYLEISIAKMPSVANKSK